MPSSYIAQKQDCPSKLDSWLKHKLKLPYSLIQKLIRKKSIKVNGKVAKTSLILAADDEVKIYANISEFNDFQQNPSKKAIPAKIIELIKKSIIYQDKQIIIINKPSGIAVQGGSGIKYSIDDALALLADADEKLRLTHRIDKDTTGILVLAREKESAKIIADGFKNKLITKTYVALLEGKPKNSSGTVKIKIAKELSGKIEKVIENDAGQDSITEYKLIDHTNGKFSLVIFTPITGRTHQIRVVAKHLGCPIVGDRKYGSKIVNNGLTAKMHLHAYKIDLSKLNLASNSLHKSKIHNIFTAKLPDHFGESLKFLGMNLVK